MYIHKKGSKTLKSSGFHKNNHWERDNHTSNFADHTITVYYIASV